MITQEKLNSIFCIVFDDSDIAIDPSTTANDIDGWDSLSHMNLIVAVEVGFGIRFNHKEILSFKNVGDLLNCIKLKLAERS